MWGIKIILWECLWEILLVILSNVERARSIVGRTITWFRDQGLWERESARDNKHALTHRSLSLTMDGTWPATLILAVLTFLYSWTEACYCKPNKPLLHQVDPFVVFYHINSKWNQDSAITLLLKNKAHTHWWNTQSSMQSDPNSFIVFRMLLMMVSGFHVPFPLCYSALCASPFFL